MTGTDGDGCSDAGFEDVSGRFDWSCGRIVGESPRFEEFPDGTDTDDLVVVDVAGDVGGRDDDRFARAVVAPVGVAQLFGRQMSVEGDRDDITMTERVNDCLVVGREGTDTTFPEGLRETFEFVFGGDPSDPYRESFGR